MEEWALKGPPTFDISLPISMRFLFWFDLILEHAEWDFDRHAIPKLENQIKSSLESLMLEKSLVWALLLIGPSRPSTSPDLTWDFSSFVASFPSLARYSLSFKLPGALSFVNLIRAPRRKFVQRKVSGEYESVWNLITKNYKLIFFLHVFPWDRVWRVFY